MTQLKRYFFVALLAILPGSLLMAANNPTTLDEAKKMSADSGKPILIDFYAVWCGPCKLFNKESKSDAEVKQLLEKVVLLKVDAEKGKGPELAKQYGVNGYPTFTLLTEKGESIAQWTGYSKMHLISTLTKQLANPIPFSQKMAQFENKPTAGRAVSLAEYFASTSDLKNAEKYFQKAEELDPSMSYAANVFELKIMTMRNLPGQDAFAELEALANKAIQADKVDPTKISLVFNVMIDLYKKMEENDKMITFIKAAHEYKNKHSFPEAESIYQRTLPVYLVYVEKKPEQAVEELKKNMPEGWQDQSMTLNMFAWWCFENKVGMQEALTLAQKGVSLANPGREKAMLLDTQAELEHALGNTKKAIELSQKAIEEFPQDSYFKQQLKKFETALK
ncbi:MAG: hypothetical protein CR997_06995 [Acidobacteria bacterium]|nr:MAG: hypothetical protein CR997_06995 [Acidobacteriota bacterium]